MANKDRLLTFEEFKREKNSFDLHFVGPIGEHLFGDRYRSQPWFRLCAAAHPEFAKLVAELSQQMADRNSPEFAQKSYEAYKLMHPYAETNWDMFM